MRNTHILRLTKFLFIFLLLLGTSPAHTSEYSSNFETVPAVQKMPPRVGSWKYTPTVLVCEHTPVDETAVKSAVQWWKQLGFKFYKVLYKRDPLNKCSSKNPEGYIIIHLVTQEIHKAMENDTLAETHFYIDNDTKKIEWAKIYLRAEPQTRVLEHEIGHALGFLHYNNSGHIMHKKWIYGGWDDEGLKR